MKPLIETIRISEGIIRNLNWHQRRCNDALQTYFKSQSILNLSHIISSSPPPQKGLFRCRITYDLNNHHVDFVEYKPKIIKRLRLVEAPYIDYSYKYADRSAFDKLLALNPDCDEIIILKNGFLTDTTISNIALYDGKQWFTPNTYILNGTTRQRLIHNRILKETPIHINNLKSFKSIKLINAMLDFDNSKSIPIDNL